MDSVLLEAKREYTEQVVSKVTRPLYDEIYNIWKKSLEENPVSPMRHFQDSLENLAGFDEKDMLAVTDRCINKISCSYFGDLITAIFVSHTRVLLSVRKDSTKDGYRLQVPTPNRFIRACLLCCAREFWKSPYLYYQNEQNNKITKIQVQKNLREAETIIAQAVRDTIRSLLPLKDVLDVAIIKGDTGDIVIDADQSSEPHSDKSEDASVESKETPDVDAPMDAVVDATGESKEIPDVDAPMDTAEESKEIPDVDATADATADATVDAEEESKDTPVKDDSVVLTPNDIDVSNERTSMGESSDPLGDAIAKVQDSFKSQELPTYTESDIQDDDSETESESVGDFPGWDTIEIKSPPDEQILMESVSDAISLDPVEEEPVIATKTDSDEFTIEAEEL